MSFTQIHYIWGFPFVGISNHPVMGQKETPNLDHENYGDMLFPLNPFPPHSPCS